MSEKKLGFGLMRLPRKGVKIDIEHCKKMVDLFMDAGFTYFDTAFIYPGSEAATKKFLVDRYPRESFTLATKMNAFIISPTEKSVKSQFDKSLKKTGAGYFDYYLLHALMESNVPRYEKYGIWDFVNEKKEKGLIKHAGFSFHGGPKLLDELLTKHPEVDFVQLQINYEDWEKPVVASRANYEVARKHGVDVIVMEPVKGGRLAKPPKEIAKMFDEYAPGASYASWAIRFVASLDGVKTVLSGMSNIEQMQDNLSYMTNFKPLNEEERAIIRKAQEIYGRSKEILCTACKYCLEGCPKNIDIPQIFAAANMRIDGDIEGAKRLYDESVQGKGRASDCIQCKKCMNACSQHVDVVGHMREAAEYFD